MRVSGYVSNINTVLVQDRMSYALHNARELIIMQMRHEAGIRTRVEKEGLEGNPTNPGNPRKVMTRLGNVRADSEHNTTLLENNKRRPSSTGPEHMANNNNEVK